MACLSIYRKPERPYKTRCSASRAAASGWRSRPMLRASASISGRICNCARSLRTQRWPVDHHTRTASESSTATMLVLARRRNAQASTGCAGFHPGQFTSASCRVASATAPLTAWFELPAAVLRGHAFMIASSDARPLPEEPSKRCLIYAEQSAG
jgi:hypothetical protein